MNLVLFFPLDGNAQRESERIERGKKCIVTQAFVEAGTRQFKADSHMLILKIQIITESYCPRVKTYNLTFRKIDSTLFFTVTSFGKLICMAV